MCDEFWHGTGFSYAVDYVHPGPVKTRWVVGGRRVSDVMWDPPEALDEVNAEANREDLPNTLQVAEEHALTSRWPQSPVVE
jgi:hypothetical protein